MDTTEARQIVRDMFDAANANDLDRQATYWAEDCTYVFRAYGIDVQGRPAVRSMLGSFLDRFPDRQLEIKSIIAEGDRVAVEYDYVATSPGGVPGLPERGQPLRTPLCSVAEIHDGRIRHWRDYLDRQLA